MTRCTCGCCEGIGIRTPLPPFNRPGLSEILYRTGTHYDFFSTMVARLSSSDYLELSAMTTRDLADPAIAFLDGWAVLADVLTFYSERIANELYLRTAIERRSVLELARLVGYKLKPGVAATVFLAFTLDPDGELTLDPGTRTQSIPAAGEQAQSFELTDPLYVTAEWNTLVPRSTQPQLITAENVGVPGGTESAVDTVYLKGLSTGLQANHMLLFIFGTKVGEQVPRAVHTVEIDSKLNRTKVTLAPPFTPPTAIAPGAVIPVSAAAQVPVSTVRLDDLISALPKTPSILPKSAMRMPRSLSTTFAPNSDAVVKAIQAFNPALQNLYVAWAHAALTPKGPLRNLAALTVRAAPFGSSAPQKPIYNDRGVLQGFAEWPIAGSLQITIVMFPPGGPATMEIRTDDHTLTRDISFQPAGATSTVDFDTIGIKVDVSQHDISNGAISTFKFSSGLPGIEVAFAPESGTMVSDTKVEGESVRVPIGGSARQSLKKGRVNITVGGDPNIYTGILEVPSALTPEQLLKLPLDRVYDQIAPGAWIALQRAGDPVPEIFHVRAVENISMAAYMMSSQITLLTLDRAWLPANAFLLSEIRNISVLAQAEPRDAAEKPQLVEEPVPNILEGKEIELDRLLDGFLPGRWIIVSGERADIPGSSGTKAAELAMVSAVRQDVAQITTAFGQTSPRPGDSVHTFLELSANLAFKFKRSTVTVWGNVGKASHGETHSEPLGSGDASASFQSFTLRQSPLTYVSAETPSGIESTLQVRVNGVLWHEVDQADTMGPLSHDYVTSIDDDQVTSVTFGNGKNGSRLPSGTENITAVYRSGIGSPGNVKAGQISILSTRPLGLKDVINPLDATGGADREDRDSARNNVPTGVMALDRLVSVQDYAFFARTFAGIGKAVAERLGGGTSAVVHVTIAGAADIPIDPSSDLYRNLIGAYAEFGDPHQRVAVDVRERVLLVLSARIQIDPYYLWENVLSDVTAILLKEFSFDKRHLGEDAVLGDVYRAIHKAKGVVYVDIDAFGGLPEKILDPTNNKRRSLSSTEIPDAIQRILDDSAANGPAERVVVAGPGDGTPDAAQIAYFTPDVPGTLNLQELT